MTPAPNRRWLRFAFSLRTLFVVMTILSLLVLLSVQSLRINQLQNQLEAVRAQNEGVRKAAVRAHSDSFARHPELLTAP